MEREKLEYEKLKKEPLENEKLETEPQNAGSLISLSRGINPLRSVG